MSAKACFVVKPSRYESRLSPSIRRRPRLLPGQVTTTLEINSASISLQVIALLNGISSTCNHRRRLLRLISENNCERISRSNKTKQISLSRTKEKESRARSSDPTCADLSYAFCTKSRKPIEILVKWNFELFCSSYLLLIAIAPVCDGE